MPSIFPTQATEGLPRWRWSVSGIQTMAARGIIDQDRRFEVTGGEVVPMSPKGRRHETMKIALNRLLQGATPGGQHPLRHGLAFLFSGGLAFLIDAGVLQGLVGLFGLHPILARVVSLSCAHLAGWLSHRRFTFRMATPPTVREFVRYASVQSTVALLNYGIFALIVVLVSGIQPLLALVASSGVAMVFSYFGIRFGAFHQGTRDPRG